MTKKTSLFTGLLFITIQQLSFFSISGEIDDKKTVLSRTSYYNLAPDLTTNFVTKNKNIGYIQVRVTILVANPKDLLSIKKHTPQIRNILVEQLGLQSEKTIKSLIGREEIRKECLTAINNILITETGKALAQDLLFTKYLYQ